MRTATFTLPRTDDDVDVFVYHWQGDGRPKAIVQIAHGLAEHAARYARLAAALTAAGYVVYANDHRGHGRTVRDPRTRGLLAATDGWRRTVADLARLNAHARAAHPGASVILLGHSLGSFLSQQYLLDYADTIAGAALSATSIALDDPAMLAVARAERARLGPYAPSTALAELTFGGFNEAFAPTRTSADWLSRDAAEVDAYVADPDCGFAATAQLWIDLLEAGRGLVDPAAIARIPKTLPLYLFAGSRDPIHANGAGFERLLASYRDAGLRAVRHRLYPDGRHELLNDVNRAEVTADLVAWLDGVIDGGAA